MEEELLEMLRLESSNFTLIGNQGHALNNQRYLLNASKLTASTIFSQNDVYH